jgi:hypothetical protein
VDRGHDLLVDPPGQDHLDHLDRGGVGDAQPVDEGGADLEAVEHRLDLRPAAVDHDRVDADLLEQHHVRAKSAAAATSPIAWPPYLMTMTAPGSGA